MTPVEIAAIKTKLSGMEKKNDQLVAQNQLIIANLDKLSIQINELFRIKIEDEKKTEEEELAIQESHKAAALELIRRRLNYQAMYWGEFSSTPEFPNFEVEWKAEKITERLRGKADDKIESSTPEQLALMFDHFVEFVPNSDGVEGVWKKRKTDPKD